jgi:hypothetical protein
MMEEKMALLQNLLRAEDEILTLQKLIVSMYYFIIPSQRIEYPNWDDMSTNISIYLPEITLDATRKLFHLVKMHPRLPLGTKMDDQRVSMPGFFATMAIFYVSLPGKPWNDQYPTREINISLSQRCTSNRFGISICTLVLGVRHVCKISLDPNYTGQIPPTHGYDMEIFCETIAELMSKLNYLAKIDSFEDLYADEVKRHLDARKNNMINMNSFPPPQKGISSSQKRRTRRNKNKNKIN